MAKHSRQKIRKLHRVIETSETENDFPTLYSGESILNLETYKIMQRSGSIPSALVNDLRILAAMYLAILYSQVRFVSRVFAEVQ